MRAVVQGIEVEGTPQEIAEFIASIQSASEQVAKRPAASSDEQATVATEEGVISVDFAYRTLRRLPLSRMQKSLLLALKGAHPGWIGASEIQREMSWTGMQLGGVLGGLGRRLTATKGYKAGLGLWEWKWNDDEGEYAYRLFDGVVAALDRMEL